MIDTSIPDRSKMRFLRSDLIVTPTQNPPGCSVRDARSGEVYEFGAVEDFLLSRLRKPYRTEDLSKECNDRFDLNYRNEDIEEFIEMLASWELLQDGRRQSASLKDKIDIPHDEDDEDAAAAPPVEEESGPRQPGGWHLFNPEALLDGLNKLLGPLRFLVWLVPIAFVIGGLAVMFHWSLFLADVVSARAHFGILGRLALFALTISLADQIARGMVARHHGLSTPSFGMALGLGLIPRFNIQIAGADASDRKTRLWLYGVPTLVRIGLFGASTLMWSMNRASASFLAPLGAELALLSAIVLLLGSNPLWRGDGSRFLSVLFDVPNIQKRARSALFGFFVKRPVVIERYSKNVRLLGLFGLLSMAFLLVVLGFLAIIILRVFLSLEERFQGAGVALFVLTAAYIAFSIRRATKVRKRTARGGESMQTATSFTKQSPRYTPRRGAAMASHDKIGEGPKSGRNPWQWQRWLRYGLLLAFVIFLFLPYTYHPGGEAEVFPAAKATLPAEVDGVVDGVFFKGGEWIEAGATLGKLADYQQVKDLRTTEASLESKKFEIEQLRTTPSAEQIELGEAEVESAKLRWNYAVAELKRQKPLFDAGGISVKDYELLKETAETRHRLMVEAKADLVALKAQVNPNQIESLKAEVDRLKNEIVFFNEQLRRTSIVSPISGEITTKDLDYLRGTHLKEGTAFAEVEDTRRVRIQIAVPESDIGEVKIGAKVSLRLWAYPNREFVGEVSAIQPSAEETTAIGETGQVSLLGTKEYISVTVTSLMDNSEGLLKSGLTGQAKIHGERTIVAVAFTKAIVRFLRVELWSWIP